ncbi:hypothetical protein [Streptomyces phaeoluteigriseus]
MAAALCVPPDNARALPREWANGRHHLAATAVGTAFGAMRSAHAADRHRGGAECAKDEPAGLGRGRRAVVLALTELGDDERAHRD